MWIRNRHLLGERAYFDILGTIKLLFLVEILLIHVGDNKSILFK